MMHTSDNDEDLIVQDAEVQESLSGEESRSSDASEITGGLKSESTMDEAIAKNETNTVFRMKIIVYLVLLFSAIAVSTAFYFYTAGNEESQFEKRFEADANKVLDDVGSSIERTLGSFDSLAVTLVSFAHANNMSWPFVTLPNVAVTLSKILPQTNGAYISINPVVTPEQRKKWEEYSFENQFWVNESMAFQETWKKYSGPIIYDWTPDPVIHGIFENEPYNLRYVRPMQSPLDDKR
jgi:hypothetical protein